MKPAPFAYVAPRTVDEALQALATHGDDAKVLAGGQSLVPMLNFRLARPRVLVDINRVAGLDDLREHDGILRVGALVRQRRLERWAAAPAPLLATGLRHVGHQAIRNRGTVAGSVAHADPASELPAMLLCLEGSVIALSASGERTIPARELFVGPLMTVLRPDELVVETRWPLPGAGTGWGFHEVARRLGDFAMVGAVAVVALAADRIDRVRLAVFGCGATPQRVEAVEKALTGQTASAAVVDSACRVAGHGLDAHDDIHASAGYRRQVAGTLLGRALTDAIARARTGLK